MKELLTLLITIILFYSCNNSPVNTRQENKDSSAGTETVTDIETSAVDAETHCFASLSAKDTVMLTLTKSGDAVSGSLLIHYREKDRNEGTITGMMRGDTLLADYAFFSEGKRSVRQVAFLKKDNALIEGYGEVQERDGKMIFRNPGTLDFRNGMRLQEGPCAK